MPRGKNVQGANSQTLSEKDLEVLIEELQTYKEISNEVKRAVKNLCENLDSYENFTEKTVRIFRYKLLKAARLPEANECQLNAENWASIYNLHGLTVRYQLKKIFQGKKMPSEFSAEFLETCTKHLLTELPIADKEGFVYVQKLKYATVAHWAIVLELSAPTVEKYVKKAGLSAIKGKTVLGRTRDFFPETGVRKACAELLSVPSKADSNGFFTKDTIVFGMSEAWALKHKVSKSFMSSKAANLPYTLGRDRSGRSTKFYAKDTIQAIFQERQSLPKITDDGFVIKENKTFGTYKAWAKEFDLPVSTVTTKIKDLPKIKGILSDGQEANLHEEEHVTQLLNSIPKNLPKAQENGEIILKKTLYRTINGWAKHLRIHEKKLKNYLSNGPSIQGVTTNGHIAPFFSSESLSDHVEYIKLLMELRECKSMEEIMHFLDSRCISLSTLEKEVDSKKSELRSLVKAILLDERFKNVKKFIACARGFLPVDGIKSDREAYAVLSQEIIRLRRTGKWLVEPKVGLIIKEEWANILKFYNDDIVVKTVADYLQSVSSIG